MPAKVETQQDFYIGTIERPDPRINEERIHQKLGDIHKNKPKRLKDEEAEIIRKWEEWSLKDLPEDWQTKYNNLIKAANELTEWKKTFKDLTPPLVKKEYDKQKEQHTIADLKPIDLPADWKAQISLKDQLEATVQKLKERPTQEQLNNSVKLEADKYKDYQEIKNNYAKFQEDLNTFLNNYKKQSLAELGKYIEDLKKPPKLGEKQQEAINNYDRVKGDLKLWTDTFNNKKPNEVKTESENYLAENIKTKKELKTWTDLFKKHTPEIYWEKYDRRRNSLKQILIYVQELKDLENGSH